MGDALEVVATEWYKFDLATLPQEDQDRVSARLVSLSRKGWRQAMADQTVKHLRDGIHEVRVLGHGAAFRVLFFLAPGRSPRVVVLTACVAKSEMQKRKRLDAQVDRAMRLRAAWRAQQQNRDQEENADGG